MPFQSRIQQNPMLSLLAPEGFDHPLHHRANQAFIVIAIHEGLPLRHALGKSTAGVVILQHRRIQRLLTGKRTEDDRFRPPGRGSDFLRRGALKPLPGEEIEGRVEQLPAPVAGRQPLRRTAGILHIPNCKSVLTYCQSKLHPTRWGRRPRPRGSPRTCSSREASGYPYRLPRPRAVPVRLWADGTIIEEWAPITASENTATKSCGWPPSTARAMSGFSAPWPAGKTLPKAMWISLST